MSALACRFCDASLERTVVDLGTSPLANAYLEPDDLERPECCYPLHVRICERCLLVQLPQVETPANLFADYAYFSSYSDTWMEHARLYSQAMIERLALDSRHLVVEIASNDGYLLRNFTARGIPVLGVEPAANVAAAARRAGIETEVAFFGRELADRLVAAGRRADLLLGNNVLAHVPDVNDFVAGLKTLLAPAGTLTMEFPHVVRLIEGNQFDTIYHEHFSYFSFHTVRRIFAAHDLRIFDVEELPTHGGSLRVFAAHAGEKREPAAAVEDLAASERRGGYLSAEAYVAFGQRVERTKRELLRFLIELKERGKIVAGYGAPAKGNTLLNYCGIGRDFLQYTVDRSPHKQGRFLPGSRLPVYAPAKIFETRPDFVFILPWNLRDEIAADMGGIGSWGGRFFVAIPAIETFSPAVSPPPAGRGPAGS